MHVIFKKGYGSVLSRLFKEHIEDKKIVTAQTCLDFMAVIKDIKSYEVGLTTTQKVMVSCQADYRLGKGPKIDPMVFSHSPQKQEASSDSHRYLEELTNDLKVAKVEKEPLGLFGYLLPLSTEADILFAIKFVYVFVNLGDGSLNEDLVPALAN